MLLLTAGGCSGGISGQKSIWQKAVSETGRKGWTTMVNQDTINLLRECSAGVETAVTAISNVLDQVESRSLERVLSKNRAEHEELGNLTHSLLDQYGKTEGKTSPAKTSPAKASPAKMFPAKAESKAEKPGMTAGLSDEKVADMMYDGCSREMKTLYHSLNRYGDAEEKVREIAGKLIYLENGLMMKLRAFL